MKKHIIFAVLTCAMVLTLCGSVSAADVPTANFTGNVTSGGIPLSVQFSDTSTGNPTSWKWDFGDNSTSTAQNPVHNYTRAGNYTVSLTAINSAGNNTVKKNNYIQVNSSITNYQNIYILMANHDGTAYSDGGPANTYYFVAGGLNQLHITNSTSIVNGQVTTSSSQSGVFYITTTGGRGSNDDLILLIAVKGPIPDDFAVNIVSSGYVWTPGSPSFNNYVIGAINETFTKDDFFYGPQVLRPASANMNVIYNGQNTSDPSTAMYLLFVDLKVGNTKTASTINGGAVTVQYTFTNLTTQATFDTYAWANGYHAKWTNDATQSSYNVIGVPSADFTANVTNGSAPMDVQFTDNSTNSPTSWSWDFGDGNTSTEQNPAHTYTKPGVYTVSLTATNAGGSNIETQTITVNDITAPIVDISQAGGVFNTTQTVVLNATDDSDSATIYYTTDGSDPQTSSTRSVYSGPITIGSTTTLKYAAVDPTGNWSPIYSETYTIKSDVYVQVTPSKANPQVGDKVTYTFKVGNKGPGTAEDVVFTYVIPEGLEYNGATVDQGTVSYDEATRTLTWNLGNVTVGDPYLWLNVSVLSAGSYNLQPTVTTEGYDPELNSSIGSLLVNAVSAPTDNGSGSGSGSSTGNSTTVHAVTTTTTKTVPMQDTGLPLGGLVSALLLVGSGLALSRKK